jgi:hypothetical protein
VLVVCLGCCKSSKLTILSVPCFCYCVNRELTCCIVFLLVIVVVLLMGCVGLKPYLPTTLSAGKQLLFTHCNVLAVYVTPVQVQSCLSLRFAIMLLDALLRTAFRIERMFSCFVWFVAQRLPIKFFGLKRNASTIPQAHANGSLTFDAVLRGVGNDADLLNGYFTVPASNVVRRLYWMHIGVEIPVMTQACAQVSNTSLVVNKTVLDNHHEIHSRSGVVPLKPGTQVSVISTQSVATAYWSGFLLDNLMDPLVAFYVGRSSSTSPNDVITVIGFNKKITYDTVIVNEGNAWDAENSCFRVPHVGLYLFSVSIGNKNDIPLNATQGITSMFYLTVDRPLEELHTYATIGRIDIGNDRHISIMSTSLLVHLEANDTVYVTCHKTDHIYSDPITLATSLSAFYYRPVTVSNMSQVQCME